MSESTILKEETKFESIESEVNTNNTLISDVFEKLTDIENKLGKSYMNNTVSEKVEETSSRLQKLKENAFVNSISLREIVGRLHEISVLF